MAAMFLPVTLMFMLLWTPSLCYPTGPPNSACLSMIPSHDTNAQSSVPPYTLDLGAVTVYTLGGSLSVTVKATGSDRFKGLFLQARKKGTDVIVGSFEMPPTGFKRMECDSKINGAVSHSEASNKDASVSFLWKAPDTDEGEIEFVATIVQTKSVFWVQVKSRGLGVFGGTTNTGATATTTTAPANSASSFYTTGVLGVMLTALIIIYFK